MTKGLSYAIARVQDLVDEVSGIRFMPDYPPEKLPSAPATVCYMGAGTWNCQSGAYQWTGDLVLELLIARNQPDLPNAFELATGYVEKIINELDQDETLNATVDQIMFPIRQDLPAMVQYGELEYIMVRLSIPVNIWYAFS